MWIWDSWDDNIETLYLTVCGFEILEITILRFFTWQFLWIWDSWDVFRVQRLLPDILSRHTPWTLSQNSALLLPVSRKKQKMTGSSDTINERILRRPELGPWSTCQYTNRKWWGHVLSKLSQSISYQSKRFSFKLDISKSKELYGFNRIYNFHFSNISHFPPWLS